MERKYCNYGHLGDCCCNCVNQIKIMNHPSNKIGNGSILSQFGWACKAYIDGQESVNQAIFMDRKHGMCEFYETKLIEIAKQK